MCQCIILTKPGHEVGTSGNIFCRVYGRINQMSVFFNVHTSLVYLIYNVLLLFMFVCDTLIKVYTTFCLSTAKQFIYFLINLFYIFAKFFDPFFPSLNVLGPPVCLTLVFTSVFIYLICYVSLKSSCCLLPSCLPFLTYLWLGLLRSHTL